ncbi:penicillin-binding protein 2 [Pedobacter sp. UYEF25]
MEQLFNRKYVIQGLFIVVVIALLAKLFYIQIATDKYFLSAESNVLRKIYKYPARGAILDRHLKVIVQNEPVYDLMVLPNDVKPFDTVALANALDLTVAGVRLRLKKATAQSNYRYTPFERQISIQSYAKLQEIIYRFPGFSTQDRTVRQYPDSIAGQLFGYVKEVDSTDIANSENYYNLGDFIGKSGLERSYEDRLRGEKGVTRMVYDVHNTPQGSYADGKYDIKAESGDRLITGLDMRIQRLGEELMQNKVGAVVAIEPSTGEILAYISSPSYDPNKLVGKDWGNNYMDLLRNPYRPSVIRPIMGYYPPGSSFKPVDALIALQEGVIDSGTHFYCPGYFQAGNHRVKCEHVDGSIGLERGIARSCNTYFCHVFQKLITKNGMKNQRQTYQDWHDKVAKFGFGEELGIDVPFERPGYFYNASHYNKIYGKYWGYSTLISQAIGQGEITSTPIQMANVMAAIANRGFYITPHFIKAIGEENLVPKKYITKHYVGVDEKYFSPVIQGMQDAVNSSWGTATLSRIPNILMCGKTGTVQNPHGKNHSVFVGFAPEVNPKIAIAVIVENAGYGSTYAAPIASYLVEKYLTGEVSGSRKQEVEWMKIKNLLPDLKVKKLSKTDSIALQKTREIKQAKDSLKKATNTASVDSAMQRASRVFKFIEN